MSRKRAREMSMQTIFQMDMTDEINLDNVKKVIEEKKQGHEKDDVYMETLLTTFVNEQETVDGEISAALKDWTIDRLPKVELAILRVATTEIMFMEDIPFKVSINEALNITKVFSDEESTKYINGTLATITDKNAK